MSERFLKIIVDDNENSEADYLATKHPNAFVILYLIARRARRFNGAPDGLIIGDALIDSSDFEPKLSRQNFRTGMDKLVELNYIRIISNGKKFLEREKSTIKVTIKGMLVNLCKLTIYDTNPDDGNQRTNQRVTNDQPTTNQRPLGAEIPSPLLSPPLPPAPPLPPLISPPSLRKKKNEKELAQTASRLRADDALTFNFSSFSFEGISEKDQKDWEALYPFISVNTEIKRAEQWVKSNPTKGNKKLWRKFLTNWFQRANEAAENKKAYAAAKGLNSVAVDRRTRDREGNPVSSPHDGRF